MKYFLIIFIIIVLSCNDKDIHQIDQYLMSNTKLDIDSLKTELNINSINELNFKDIEKYYIIALKLSNYQNDHIKILQILDKYLHDKKSSIFIDDALKLYEKTALITNHLYKLAGIMNKYPDHFNNSKINIIHRNYKQIDLSELDEYYFELVVDYYLSPVFHEKKYGQLYTYILSYFKNTETDITEKFKAMYNKNNDIIFEFLYYYTLNDINSITKITNTLLDNKYVKINFDKFIALYNKLDLKKFIFTALQYKLSESSKYRYYYALFSSDYLARNNSSEIIRKSLPFYHNKSDEYYNLKSKNLYQTYNLNPQWAEEVITLHNEFKNYYHSKGLVVYLLRSILFQNKQKEYLDIIKQIDISGLNWNNKSIIVYLMYLIDKEGKWDDILEKEAPFSYGNVMLKQEKIAEIIPDKSTIGFTANSTSDYYSILKQKLEYYSKFNCNTQILNFIHNYEIYNDLSNGEKLSLLNIIYKYLLKIKDFYNSIRFATRIAELKFTNEWLGIDKETLSKLFPMPFSEIVKKYAEQYQLEPALLYALMREESHFHYSIRSHASAVGLMQLMPATAEWLAPKMQLDNYSLTNPDDNIHFGSYFLNYLFTLFDDVEWVMAAYNAGQGRVRRWERTYKPYPRDIQNELIPIEETRHYIRKVSRSYHIYKYLLSTK